MRWRLFLVLALLLSPLALIMRSTGAAGPALYPDLRTTNPSGLYFDRVWIGGSEHRVLRFSNTVWNAGEGRLELQGDPNPNGSSAIYQNLYDGPTGGSRVSQNLIGNDLIYHAAHYHYHFANFASYLLLKRDGSGNYQPTSADGSKTSFCVLDSIRINSSGPSYKQYPGCGGTRQGLAVGWGDTYAGYLPEQWVDLGTSPLANGSYALQSTADPFGKINEGGRDSNNAGTTYFSVSGGSISIGSTPTQATCSMSPSSGLVGSSTKINCSGFGASETVRIYLDTTAAGSIASGVSTSSGAAGITFTVPDAVRGQHGVVAVGATSNRTTTTTFTVNPRLLRTPVTGPPGASVQVTVKGFGADEPVQLTWNSATGPTIGSITTDDKGAGTTTITIPQDTPGWHDYSGFGLRSGARAWGAINVTIAPTPTPTPTPVPTPTPPVGAQKVQLNLTSAQVGKPVVVTGSGFEANESVQLFLDSTSTTPLANVTAGSTGSYSTTINVPERTGGAHQLIARGATSTGQGTAALTVLPSLSRSPIEGPVGTTVSVTARGFGANEIVRLGWDPSATLTLANITANANGAGTITFKIPNASLGWHEYSGRGLTTNLRGYGAIRVLPAPNTQLSSSVSAVQVGHQFTLSGSGFQPGEPVTIHWDDSTSPPIGNLTASSSGTFSAQVTAPPSTGGSHPVIARGQTSGGEDSIQIAVKSSLSRTPIQGAPGAAVTVTVKGFGANESVRLHWDSPTGPLLGTVTTDGSGVGTTVVFIPQATPGWHEYSGIGLTSNLRGYGAISVLSGSTFAASSLAPAETVILEPTEAPALPSEPTMAISPAATNVPPVAPTATSVPPTIEPTATSIPPTIEPTVPPAIGTAIISGTGGEGARCRVDADIDADVITVLPEGTQVGITGSETADRWQPVICSARAGFVHDDFITTDDEIVPPEEPPPPPTDPPQESSSIEEAHPHEQEHVEPDPTEDPVEEPTPTVAPVPTEVPAT